MQRYPEDAWERAMKVQEVILRAMAKRITWGPAAEILGISVRSMRRGRGRYEQYGYAGLFDRRRGRPSSKRVPLQTGEEVLRLYEERYPDFNVRHFHEKLRAAHESELSYTGVKRALQGAGRVKKARKRGVRGGGGRPGPGRGCCCPGTGVTPRGFTTLAGTTCSRGWTTPRTRPTTHNGARRNRPAR